MRSAVLGGLGGGVKTVAASSHPTADICNACTFLYDNPDTALSVFQCQENGMTFYRTRPTALPVFTTYFNSGMFGGQCQLASSYP